MVNTKKSFIVYGNVVLVLGHERNGIYDLKGHAFFLGKEHTEKLETIFDKRFVGIDLYKSDDHIRNLCDVIEKQNIGKWLDSKLTNCFIKPDFRPKCNSTISNAILDIDSNSFDYEIFIQQLSDTLCPFIQIRFYPDSEIRQLLEISKLIEKHQILNVQMLFPFRQTTDFLNEMAKLLNHHPRITELILYGAPHLIVSNNKTQQEGLKITELFFENESDCGKIGPDYFIPSLRFYMESLHYNTCLNRKISLDRNGFIKNCPSMYFNYGHIKDTSINEVLNNKKFKKWWFITKDQIEECRDCEYRHMCSDCRAFRKDSANIFSKPLKCNYSVYRNGSIK